MIDVRKHTPVSAGDRVSDVLDRDESLVEVFVRHAPHFAKLRTRAMRRVMARLVTVEQAARTANVSVDRLVRDLNDALGITVDGQANTPTMSSPAAETAAARHPAAAHVVDLDVRDDLRFGREPFSRIMAAVAGLTESDVLHLRAIFEPVPLFTALEKRGFTHESLAHASDDWSVWFWRPTNSEAALHDERANNDAASNVPTDDACMSYLDVRGLDPPDPMLRTLSALETLPRGHTLVQVNNRVPQFLFPVLAERGFACQIDESHPDRVLVRIWHAR